MKFQRKRFVIMRNNRTEVLCGLASKYDFKKVNEVGSTALKTYVSESKAQEACNCWSPHWLGDYEIVPVIESVETED